MVSLAMFGFVLVAAAGPAKVVKHNHNSGSSLLASNKKDGTHQLTKKGKHAVSADVKGGKIAAMHVKHDTKGDVAVKKYKSKKKMASLDGSPSETQPASLEGALDAIPMQSVGTEWIAYAYVDDDGNEEYYWFEYDEVYDPDTGAIDYVPLS
jgi:hypothetical protein